MILIISDYHKREDEVLALIKEYNPEYVLCCGDGESDDAFYEKNKIISVKGNCDYANLPITKVVDILDKRFLLTHGHLYDVYFDIFKLYLLAKENNANIVLYGHTHNQLLEEYEGVIFINPGALKDGNYALIVNDEVILK